jgi:peptidoglycan-associated lipoprotein
MRGNGFFRISMAIVLVPLCLTLLGCPKKTPPPKPVTTEVSTETMTPALPPKTTTATTPQVEARREAERIAALKGDDIPLRETPTREFVSPTPAEREIFRTIFFDYDKSDIRPEFQAVLDGQAAWLKNNPSRLLLVEGHCDERGTNEYNLALGERRALSVRRYLIGLGVVAEKIHTISYGKEKPADPGHSEAAWAKNRRAEFKLSTAE